jgi:hypothetical protein
MTCELQFGLLHIYRVQRSYKLTVLYVVFNFLAFFIIAMVGSSLNRYIGIFLSVLS